MIFMTEQERKKVEVLKNESRYKWEKEQARLQTEAEKKGETFTPEVYQEVSDEDALEALRNGWKSWIDEMFEKKKKRDLAHGFDWNNQRHKY